MNIESIESTLPCEMQKL